MLHITEGGTLHPVIASQTTLESHSNRIGHLESLHPKQTVSSPPIHSTRNTSVS